MADRVAIFGGTFNPIHIGHLLLAEAALDYASLQQIIWVPAGHPPHRAFSPTLPITHRVEMVRRAIAHHPAFTLSTLEAEAPPPSYAVQTFLALQSIHPNHHWHWIVGLDTFLSLPRWYRRQDFLASCTWLVAPRPQSGDGTGDRSSDDRPCQEVAAHLQQEGIHLTWYLLPMPLVAISSSLIRQYCRDRHSIRYMVPDEVGAYIEEQGLYRGEERGERNQ